MDIIDRIGEKLKSLNFRISTAESCTSGYISNILTSKSGSSKYFEGGIIVYSNDAKVNVLGVERELINLYTEVSEEVALDMAKKANKLMNTDVSIATTGYADVFGFGTEENPPGTIFIAISTPFGDKVKRLELSDSRSRNNYLTSIEALEMIEEIIEIHQVLSL